MSGAAFSFIQWTKPLGKPLNVALIQGNIPQQLKWTPEFLTATLHTYEELTQQNWNNPLIIWPETAIPLLKQDAMPFLLTIDQKAKQHQVALITGIPIQEGFTYYNAAIALGTGGGTYYKRHLVPFGEYTPLVDWFGKLLDVLNIPMSDFREGPYQQPQMHIPEGNVAVFICYEIAYPALALSELPKANILITISNDAWFGHSFASAQHLQIGQIRAEETGRYHLFSSNSGLTAIINPQGKILAIAPPFQTAVLTGSINAMSGATPLVHIGLNTIIGMIALLLIIAWLWELPGLRAYFKHTD